jgi:hypothetical protein
MIWCKNFPCLMRIFSKNNNHKGTHEECSISLFGIV